MMIDSKRTNRPEQSGAITLCLLLSLILFFSAYSSVQANPPDRRDLPRPERLFSWGQDCKGKLKHSKKRQRIRQNWVRCINYFVKLENYYPEHPLASKALFQAAELSRNLYRWSGKRKDIENARRYYQQVITKSEDNELVDQAKEKLAKLDDLMIDRQSSRITQVNNIRSWTYPNYTRVVLDMDREVQYEQSRSPNPGMATIVLHQAVLAHEVEGRLSNATLTLPKQIIFKETALKDLVISIPFRGIKQYKVLPLSDPDRLVIDLFMRPSNGEDPPVLDARAETLPSSKSRIVKALPADAGIKIKTIVLDPGHGGKDPGAIGMSGLTEKEVALDIALRLRNLIQKELGKTVIMTRDTDTYVSLEDRTLIANAKQADLFVSIHTNSHPKRSTRGVEIYLLGRSSDRRARTVAARENSTPEKSVDNLQRVLKSIQHDLVQDYNIEESLKLAHETRDSFLSLLKKDHYDVVDLGVKRAPFYVLLNANMPGILAEVSFISNRVEERRLRSNAYRQTIAEALLEGIKSYLASLNAIS
jgi:N-acetylmuramoyl-L-alanine amidase